MLLQDNLVQTTHMLARTVTRHGRHLSSDSYPVIAPYIDITQRLQGVPRFLLDDNAIHAAVELTLGRPKVLVEALAHCRVPYPAMWIEWSESGRAKLHENLRKFGIEEVAGRPVPDRIGFLIEAGEGGRSGRVTWAWATGDLPPNIGAVEAVFDLDGHFPQDDLLLAGFDVNNLRQMWEDNPVQLRALEDLWSTAEHRPSALGEQWLLAGAKGDADRLDYLTGGSFADVYGEYITIWAVMLLLTADRKPVSYRPVDRSKLNKIRQKKGETLLLDHTEVVLNITRPQPGPVVARGPLDGKRRSPRLHLVSRYLGRRGDKHWLVEPYSRGHGQRLTRHINVRG